MTVTCGALEVAVLKVAKDESLAAFFLMKYDEQTNVLSQFCNSEALLEYNSDLKRTLIITLVFVGYLLHLLRMCLRSTIACGVLFAADSRSAVNVKPGLHYKELWLCFSWWHFSLLPFNRSTPAHISYLCLYDRVFMIALSNPLLFFNSFMTQ